jgi:hypothetical protein
MTTARPTKRPAKRRLRGTLAILAAAFVFATAGGVNSCEEVPPEGQEPSERPQQQEDGTIEPPDLPDEKQQEFSLVPAEEAAGDQAGNQAAPNEPAWQGCLFNWMLDWPIEANESYTLDATYGSNYSCDLPAMGGPTIDASIQTTLYDQTTGEKIDEAEFVTGGWDTEDYIESSDTLNLAWPHEIRLTSHLEMQLIPGCDVAGCGDPDPGWVWGPMPAGCESPGPWLAVCEYEWANIQIGNTSCPDEPSFQDGSNTVDFEVTCGSATGNGVSVSAEIHNASDDGKCTYAVAVFRGGPQAWDAVCEPDETKTVDLGSGEGPITHVYLTRIAN